MVATTAARAVLTWGALQQALLSATHPLCGGCLEAIRIAAYTHTCTAVQPARTSIN
jgi:hypothetical protein